MTKRRRVWPSLPSRFARAWIACAAASVNVTGTRSGFASETSFIFVGPSLIALTKSSGIHYFLTMSKIVEKKIGELTVRIDRELCIGSGNCVKVAPDLFELDEEVICSFAAGAESTPAE